jgi:adenylate cyclase
MAGQSQLRSALSSVGVKMVANLHEEELAELAPCSLGQVRKLIDLGLLMPRDEDKPFRSSDVHLVRLMAAFDRAGISLDDVARGVATGELSFRLDLFLPEPAAVSGTYEALAADLGRSPELLRRLSSELGLPPPPDDRIRSDDADMLSRMVVALDLVDDDELSRFARLYGGSMQRLIGSALQFFDRAIHRRIIDLDLSNEEKDILIDEKGARVIALVNQLVPWLQRRLREHAVLEYMVTTTESYMDERGIAPRRPRQPPAIAFLDLTGYTALTEERGDEAAAELAADLASIVQEGAQAHGGRPVKWLGDGVMFHFAHPGEAVLSGLDLVERTESAISVPTRIGINAGAVIIQEGDYFGRTVNIAARITDYAGPHEVLVSEEAKQRAGLAGVAFEPIGDIRLKGLSGPVTLHRATRV